MSETRDQARLFRRAMRTGQAPAGLDRQRWLPVVRRRATLLRTGRPFVVGAWVTIGVLLLAVAAVGVVTTPFLVWFAVLLALVTAPVAYLTDRLWVRARGSIGALLADLEGADQR
ncbi:MULTISPECIES: hypothetical protein [unclassified Aeromicrobium]|jgi:hypothetical protein|uniref:hypothetical protein n=1 Tax=unclassified Aeromicrobium TaxID=2633570 RepID=UPI000A6B06BF|nr:MULTISPECIES: hypothetical protein [unclassified Aeromicrobium]